ncbi:putative serine protease K12H4.7 [Wyeomyia smithii]|uniref:putative serine protease K12H4.7 n=1 Tax=Wyeomyia smithii TaxID=174621 RepID=UPI002467E49F|nr:putative serine protease K12H4.7 [Wyeomyia smithii]
MLPKLLIFFGATVALATAAIHLDPSRPLLFGTQRIIPQAPASEVDSTAAWNTFSVRQSYSFAQDLDEFPMRYVTNDQFYVPGGPIFIFIGGPWELEAHLVEQGHFVDIAREMNGFLVANELRYYGESIPTEDASRENLRFLSMDQILPDIASFITHIKNDVVRNPGARVVLTGVGFSGSIALWTRKRYQHLVQGVWSAGGMVEASDDFRRFSEEVGENIRRFGSDDCYNAIWQGFGITENLLDAGLSTTVDQLFNVCTPIVADDPLDVAAFFNGIFNEISMLAVNINLRENIEDMCRVLTDPDQPNGLTALSDWLTGIFPDTECLTMDFQSVVNAYQVTNWEDEMLRNGERQWLFQRCTSLGWPLTSGSLYQPFGNRITPYLFLELCERLFDDWLSPQVFRSLVRNTNMFFGAGSPDVQRVTYTYGSLDPWRYTGVRYAYEDSYVRIIQGATHGEEMASLSEDDSFELRMAKERVSQDIRRWVYARPPGPP